MAFAEKIRLCPILKGRVYSPEAEFYIPSRVENGWYWVDITYHTISREADFTDLLKIKTPIKAWSFQDKYVATSFDIEQRALRAANLKLANAFFVPQFIEDFTLLEFCIIRKKIFFVRSALPSPILFLLKAKLEEKEKIQPQDIKTLSPEQVYLLGCYAFLLTEQEERLRQRTLAAQAESLEVRLRHVLALSNAELIKYNVIGRELVDVTWTFLDRTFISTVSTLDLRITANASGVCLAGTDNRQTLTSLPVVIRGIIDDDALVITRTS